MMVNASVIVQYLESGDLTPDERGVRRLLDRAIAEGNDDRAAHLSTVLVRKVRGRQTRWRQLLERKKSQQPAG